MADHERFLASILAHPDDDAPRLVYADWLEEHGDGARAEFIRLQIEMARMPAKDAGRAKIAERQKALHQEHGKHWAGPLEGIVDTWEFHRGFVMQVAMRTEMFLSSAETIFRTAPVRAVAFTHPANLTPSLAECPYLSRLTSIEFQSSFEAASVTTLGDPFSTHVIAGPDDRLGNQGLIDLVGSPHLKNLVWLLLSGASITIEGLQALVTSPWARQLRRLDLSRNPIGDEGLLAIAQAPALASLEYLELRSSGIGQTLAEMLTRLIERIRGQLHQEPGLAVEALSAAPHLRKLQWLDLRGNRLSEHDRRLLQETFGASVQF